jgi:ribosomal protein S18 acetylase RimI-like enzyme
VDETRINEAHALGQFEQMVGGDLYGPLLEGSSRSLWREDEAVAGIVVVRRREPAAWDMNPFVSSLFVRRSHQQQGLGTWLLTHALSSSASAGFSKIGLSVTAGTPAVGLYRRLGFHEPPV